MTAKLNHNFEEPVALIGHGGFCEGPDLHESEG